MERPGLKAWLALFEHKWDWHGQQKKLIFKFMRNYPMSQKALVCVSHVFSCSPSPVSPQRLVDLLWELPSPGFLPGDHVSASLPGSGGRLGSGGGCSGWPQPALTVLLTFGVVVPLGLAVMRPRACGPHAPCLSGSSHRPDCEEQF